MSTTVVPSGADGFWEVATVSPERATEIVAQAPQTGVEVVSAVGHVSTAEAMSAALGIPVEANRVTVRPEPHDAFLCFRLNSRPPEGAILDRETLERVGFTWCLMRYYGYRMEVAS